MHHLRIQPSEIDALPYYEYHWMLEDLQEFLEQQKEAQEGKSNSKDKNGKKKSAEQLAIDNQKQMFKQMQSMQSQSMQHFSMPKMPDTFSAWLK